MTEKKYIKLSTARYVAPGVYLYAFVVAGKNDVVPSGRLEKLPSPEELKRIALESTVEVVEGNDRAEILEEMRRLQAQNSEEE